MQATIISPLIALEPTPEARIDRPPLGLAALAPIALGAVVAVRAGQVAPVFVVPAIIFGVVAATAPALYIASAAAGTAPTVAGVARALVTALGAFGIALAGFVLPAAFLALSSESPATTFAVTTAALAGAGLLALRRLARELRGTPPAPADADAIRAPLPPAEPPADATAIRAPLSPAPAPTLIARAVFVVWAIATLGIAARLWFDFANEVLS